MKPYAVKLPCDQFILEYDIAFVHQLPMSCSGGQGTAKAQSRHCYLDMTDPNSNGIAITSGNRGPSVEIATWIIMVAMILTTMAKIASKLIMIRKLQVDDFLMGAAVVSSKAFQAKPHGQRRLLLTIYVQVVTVGQVIAVSIQVDAGLGTRKSDISKLEKFERVLAQTYTFFAHADDVFAGRIRLANALHPSAGSCQIRCFPISILSRSNKLSPAPHQNCDEYQYTLDVDSSSLHCHSMSASQTLASGIWKMFQSGLPHSEQ